MKIGFIFKLAFLLLVSTQSWGEVIHFKSFPEHWIIKPTRENDVFPMYWVKPSADEIEVFTKFPKYQEFIADVIRHSYRSKNIVDSVRADTFSLSNILTPFAEDGDGTAKTLLASQHLTLAGVLSFSGNKTAQLHYSKAHSLLKEASSQGHRAAHLLLAITLQNGIGVEADLRMANEHFGIGLQASCLIRGGGIYPPSLARMLWSASTSKQFSKALNLIAEVNCDEYIDLPFFTPIKVFKTGDRYYPAAEGISLLPKYYSVDKYYLHQAIRCGHLINSYGLGNLYPLVDLISGIHSCEPKLEERFGTDFRSIRVQETIQKMAAGNGKAAEALFHYYLELERFPNHKKDVLNLAEFLSIENNKVAQLLLRAQKLVKHIRITDPNKQLDNLSNCRSSYENYTEIQELVRPLQEKRAIDQKLFYVGIEPLESPLYFDTWLSDYRWHFVPDALPFEESAYRIWLVAPTTFAICNLSSVTINGQKISPSIQMYPGSLPIIAFVYHPIDVPKEGKLITAVIEHLVGEDQTTKRAMSFLFKPQRKLYAKKKIQTSDG